MHPDSTSGVDKAAPFYHDVINGMATCNACKVGVRKRGQCADFLRDHVCAALGATHVADDLPAAEAVTVPAVTNAVTARPAPVKRRRQTRPKQKRKRGGDAHAGKQFWQQGSGKWVCRALGSRRRFTTLARAKKAVATATADDASTVTTTAAGTATT